MDLSLFNYGAPNNANGVYVSGQNYDNDQYSVNGNSLSPTPLDSSTLPAVDPTTDNRSAQDHKQQAIQVNKDASPDKDDDSYILGDSGYRYTKTPEDRQSQLLTSIIAYGTSWLAGNSEGVALQHAGQAVNQHINMIHRQSQIKDLESKGYNPVDIQRWIETGDNNDLLTNKGKESYIGHGMTLNSLTGAVSKIPGYPEEQQQLKYLKNDDGTYTAINPITNENKGIVGTPKAGATVPGGGETGAEPEGYIGFARGAKDNKPIIAKGEYTTDGQPLYLGADGTSRVTSDGMPYAGNITGLNAQQQNKEQQGEQKASASNQATIEALQQENKAVQELLNSKGFDTAYGSYDAWTEKFPGHTAAYNKTVAQRDKLKGEIFLNVRQKLKNQGPITDYESGRAESSRTILTNPYIGESDARQAGLDLIAENNKAIERLKSGNNPQPQQQPVQAQPTTTGKDFKHLW